MRKSLSARIAPLALALAMVGCAELPRNREAMLTYESTPLGATIFEDGKALGVAPVTRTYRSDGKSATIRTPEVTVVWPSGAKETFFTLLSVGADQVATIERPKSAPNLQADLDHAKKVAASQASAAQREKEAQAREIQRASARCKQQLERGGTPAISDCP